MQIRGSDGEVIALKPSGERAATKPPVPSSLDGGSSTSTSAPPFALLTKRGADPLDSVMRLPEGAADDLAASAASALDLDVLPQDPLTATACELRGLCLTLREDELALASAEAGSIAEGFRSGPSCCLPAVEVDDLCDSVVAALASPTSLESDPLLLQSIHAVAAALANLESSESNSQPPSDILASALPPPLPLFSASALPAPFPHISVPASPLRAVEADASCKLAALPVTGAGDFHEDSSHEHASPDNGLVALPSCAPTPSCAGPAEAVPDRGAGDAREDPPHEHASPVEGSVVPPPCNPAPMTVAPQQPPPAPRAEDLAERIDRLPPGWHAAMLRLLEEAEASDAQGPAEQ